MAVRNGFISGPSVANRRAPAAASFRRGAVFPAEDACRYGAAWQQCPRSSRRCRAVHAAGSRSLVISAGFARLKTRLLPTKCRSTFRHRAPAASALPLVLSRVHWVRPEWVAEVKYLSWTDDNLLRQVVYEGLREEAGGRRGSPAGFLRSAPGMPQTICQKNREMITSTGFMVKRFLRRAPRPSGSTTPGWFAMHSLLEGDGFEPSTPHKKQPFLAARARSRNSPPARKTGSFVPGSMVRIYLPPAASLQTVGPSRDPGRFRAHCRPRLQAGACCPLSG
jgi:hypothetical protein